MPCALFHALYEPFKAFLCLSVDVGKIGVKPAACEEIGVCNLTVLLQIVQMPLSPMPIGCFSSAGNLKSGIRYPFSS